MWKLILALCFTFVVSSQAIWLYTAPGFNLNYNLYAIDTDSYTVYTIGTLMDASGDKFVVGGMHYDATSGLVYAVGTGRGTNPNKSGGFFAFDPLTAQVAWSTNCSTAPNPRFSAIAFDSTHDRYLLMGARSTGPGSVYVLSATDMRAGNCSAIEELWQANSGDTGGAEYIPSMDSMFFSNHIDGGVAAVLINASSTSYQTTNINSDNWWYYFTVTGDFYYQSNGSLWAMGQRRGPGVSTLFQLHLGNNITAIAEGERVPGFGIRTILPRAVRGLSDGPVPTSLTKWRTGFVGAIAFVTRDNDFFVVNIDTPAIRNVTRLSRNVLALESLGSWNQMYAIVNDTSRASLALVNITTGALTTVASLPGRFQSLTRSADGSLLAMNRLETNGNVSIVRITADGSVSEVAQYSCPDNWCTKVFSDGTFYNFIGPAGGEIYKQNITEESPSMSSYSFWNECPDAEIVDPSGSCGYWSNAGAMNVRLSDVTFYPPTQGSLFSFSEGDGLTHIFRYNATSGRALLVIDFRHGVSDMAYFQYDAAWCSNRGTWNGEVCVCNNASIVGSRCETVIPPPAGPPLATPVAVPVAVPVATPSAAAPTAVPVGQSVGTPKATSATSSISASIGALGAIFAFISFVMVL